jgi:metal-dependent amidase/aminoacylase/carboxypeptidase family protein
MKPRCARGHQKQDATSGHTKIEGRSLLVRGLNALAAAICPALGTPLIAATRLRGGNANAARGTASLAAEARGAARAADALRWSSFRRTRRTTAAPSTGLAK